MSVGRVVFSFLLSVVALVTLTLRGEKPDFDWKALHRQIADLVQHGRIAESEKVLEESIKAARQRGETSAGLAEALNDLGTLYHDCGRFLEAERAYKESLSHWTRIPGPNPTIGTTLGNLAGLRLAQGRPSEAEKLYRRAEHLLASARNVESRDLAFVQCGLADVYWETGRHDRAKQILQRAVPVLETAQSDPQLGTALSLQAKIAWKEKREAEAERLLRRAIELWRRSLGPRHPTYASGLTSLAVLISRKNPSEANLLFGEALEVVEPQFGANHFYAGFILVLHARHLEDLGRRSEARNLKRRGEAILNAHSRENLLGHTLDIKAFR